MDAAEVHRAASEALSGAGLVKRGRSRWYSRSPELVWVAELDRATGRPWSVQFGAVVRAWSPDNEWPTYAAGHVSQDYSLHGEAMPASATPTRFNDHRSYFTMVLDHSQDEVSDDERREALRFMAADLCGLFSRLDTVDALVAAVRRGDLGGFVHREVRDASGIT